MLGRSMAGSGFDIYKQMNQINPKMEAGAYNITAKCSMETASAREADCFTTVSRITADEATVFLGRSPDVVTPNGLDMRVIPDYSAERGRSGRGAGQTPWRGGTPPAARACAGYPDLHHFRAV